MNEKRLLSKSYLPSNPPAESGGRPQEDRADRVDDTQPGQGDLINPYVDLENRTKEELLTRASQLAIPGRSEMTKTELIEAIRENT